MQLGRLTLRWIWFISATLSATYLRVLGIVDLLPETPQELVTLLQGILD